LEGKTDDRFKEISRNWVGFTHFKEQFGREAVEFPRPYNKYFSPILKIIQKFFKMPL